MPTLVLHLGMGIWQHQKICTLDSLLASFRPPHDEMYLRYHWKYLLLGQDLKWAIHCNWPIPPRCRHLGSFWKHFTGVLSTSVGHKHQVTKFIETKMLGEQSQPTIETSSIMVAMPFSASKMTNFFLPCTFGLHGSNTFKDRKLGPAPSFSVGLITL